MKKFVQILAFQIGVDILGFPNFHKHTIHRTVCFSGKYFKAHSKK